MSLADRLEFVLRVRRRDGCNGCATDQACRCASTEECRPRQRSDGLSSLNGWYTAPSRDSRPVQNIARVELSYGFRGPQVYSFPHISCNTATPPAGITWYFPSGVRSTNPRRSQSTQLAACAWDDSRPQRSPHCRSIRFVCTTLGVPPGPT